jgi:DNA topoisomerase-6 subunit B
MKPHPRSADPELLKRLISASDSRTSLHDFLIESFQQMGVRTCSRFADFMSFDPAAHVGTLSRNDILRLSTALRVFDGFSKPDSRSLSPVGKPAFVNGVRGLYECSVLSYSTTGTCEWNGNPFMIEAVAASGDSFPVSDRPTLQRFANRVPLLYDASEDVLTKALGRLNWSRYGFTSKSSIILFTHICSTRIPYRAAGKQSIAIVPEIEEAALALFRDTGRRLKRALTKSGRASDDARRSRELAKSLRLIAAFGAELAEAPVPDTTALVKSFSEVNDCE